MRYLVVNLNGEILCETRGEVPFSAGPEKTIRLIERRISELCAKKGNPGKLRAIAIAVPSAVHPGIGREGRLFA